MAQFGACIVIHGVCDPPPAYLYHALSCGDMGDMWEVCRNPLMPCGTVGWGTVVDRRGLWSEAVCVV